MIIVFIINTFTAVIFETRKGETSAEKVFFKSPLKDVKIVQKS